jgi:hypothetical protein
MVALYLIKTFNIYKNEYDNIFYKIIWINKEPNNQRQLFDLVN